MSEKTKPFIVYYPELAWKPEFSSHLPGCVGYYTPSGNIVMYGPRPDSVPPPPSVYPSSKRKRKKKQPAEPGESNLSRGERKMFREWYGLFD